MPFRESNAVHLEILETALATGVPIELDVYDGANPGTMLEHLEGAEGVKFTLTMNEEGAGEFRISRGDPKATADVIDREHLAKVKIGGVYRFSFWMERRKIVTLTDNEEAGEFWHVSGREGTYAYMDRAAMDRVSHVGDDPIEGVYNLTLAGTGNKLGQMLMRVLDESLSKSPSPLEFMTVGFDYDADSLGNVWAQDADVQVNVGTSVLPIVKMLTGLGIDIRARHDLRLNAYEELGRHFEIDGGTGALVFRAGQNVTTSLERTSEPGIRSRMIVKGTGDQFFEVQRPDLEADPYVRRREGFLSFGNSADPTTIQRAAEAELGALAARRAAISFGVDHDVSRGGYMPFVDYDLGDWGTLDEPGVFDMETVRIVGITIEQMEDDFSVTVDANSIVLEEILKIARRVQNSGGGGSSGSSTSSVGGGGGGGGSITSPAKVAVETGDTPAYLYSKILAGDGITASVAGVAGNRQVRIDGIDSIAALLDVDLAGIQDGDGIVWDEAEGKFVPGAVGGGGGAPGEDLGTWGDDFEGVSLDAKWTLGGGATANFPDDHTVNLTFGAQKARILESLAGAPSDFSVKALIRNMSDHGTSGGMTGIALVDATGAGLVACFYAGTLYMMNLVAWAYSSTGLGGPGAPASGEAYWLHVEKVGTTYRCRWTSDPAGAVNWSAYSGGFTKATVMTHVGLVRAYVNGGSITFRLDKFSLV